MLIVLVLVYMSPKSYSESLYTPFVPREKNEVLRMYVVEMPTSALCLVLSLTAVTIITVSALDQQLYFS